MRYFDMEQDDLIELERKELGMLEEFLSALKAEKDAIISFSLEGIIRENNRKEDVLRKLEYLESEKSRLFSAVPEPSRVVLEETEAWRSLADRIRLRVKEVRTALEKNMRLLSFSMDHVKSSLEKIIDFVNRSSYEKGRSISVMISKEV
jgi:hypothetical protein